MVQQILHIIIFQMLFLATYDLLHKKDTFFSLNRLYLLFTSALSLFLPFIKIESIRENIPNEYIINLPTVFIGQPIPSETFLESLSLLYISAKNDDIPWGIVLYSLGVIVMFIVFIRKIIAIKTLKKNVPYTYNYNYKTYTLPNSKNAFSFLNNMYLGDQLTDLEKEQITMHEIVHLREKHSYDLLWFEFLKIFFWFNPLIYVYQSRIHIVHEFIADAKSIKIIGKKKYYEQLLNTVFGTEKIKFINQFFNYSLIKKRILMLQKNKSKNISKLKYLLIVPLLIGILIYTSCNETSKSEIISEIDNFENKKVKNNLLTISSEEPECPNKNSEYDKNLENFIEITSGENSKIIIDVISLKTSKSVRTIYLTENKVYKIKNIPEDKYNLHIIYGENYVEKIVDGICKAYFKNESMSEISKEVIDMHTIKTKKGVNVPSYRLSLDNDLSKNKDLSLIEIPFTKIDKVPTTMNCKGITDNLQRKECVSNEIKNFVNTNFNVKATQDFAQKGINKIYVRFKIDNTGKIIDVKAKSSAPELEQEAKRVVQSMPQMIPGEHQGKRVAVKYSLPIAFMIE